MRKAVFALLAANGIEPRGFLALLRALVLMDLRGQHYGRATATQPHFLVSPLFWVVGQCLAISALASLLLFCRVDVFFFAFANLALSMLLIASTLLVEFHEVVLDPQDLEVIGHRPIAPRTYAAARFANLLGYVALMYLALNLIPLLLGNGLPDAGPWYAPAYLMASLTGDIVVAALVILGLSLAGSPQRLERWKELLSWTQIILVFLLFYGGQLMLRNGGHALQVWGAVSVPPETATRPANPANPGTDFSNLRDPRPWSERGGDFNTGGGGGGGGEQNPVVGWLIFFLIFGVGNVILYSTTGMLIIPIRR